MRYLLRICFRLFQSKNLLLTIDFLLFYNKGINYCLTTPRSMCHQTFLKLKILISVPNINMLNPEFTQTRKQMPTLLKQICPVLNTFSLSFIFYLSFQKGIFQHSVPNCLLVSILSDYF